MCVQLPRHRASNKARSSPRYKRLLDIGGNDRFCGLRTPKMKISVALAAALPILPLQPPPCNRGQCEFVSTLPADVFDMSQQDSPDLGRLRIDQAIDLRGIGERDDAAFDQVDHVLIAGLFLQLSQSSPRQQIERKGV